MNMVAWVDRRFNFDFPVYLYPNILARLRGTPARLEDAVRGLSQEQLIATPFAKWSIQENAGHLLEEEELFRLRLDEFLAGAESLTPAAYLHRALPYNNWTVEPILENFRMARDRQVQRLLALRSDDFGRSAWHARLKLRMRLVDHLLFFAEHDDHHLARIWQIRCDYR